MRADDIKLKVIIYTLSVLIASFIAAIFDVCLVDYVFSVLFLFVFIWIAFFDMRFHLIPNSSLAIMCVLRCVWILLSEQKKVMLIDGAISCGFFIIVMLVAGIAIRKLKMTVGSGDYKYIIAMAFCLGMEKMVEAMVIALVIAVIAYIAGKLLKKDETYIPAAPFLSSSAAVAMIICMLR